MAIARTRQNTIYGFPNPLANQFPEPIVMNRNPTTFDQGEIGQTWVRPDNNTAFILTSSVAGVNTWSTSPVVPVNPLNLDVINNLTVGGTAGVTGNISTAGTLLGDALNITNNAVIGGTLGVTGISTFTGDVVINGDFDINSGDTVTIQSSANSPAAVRLFASNAAGGITMDAGTQGYTISTATNGPFNVQNGTGTITLNGTGAQAINIGTQAAVVKTIAIGGTGANVITIGNTQTAGSFSLGAAMTTGTINIGGTGLQTGTVNLAVGTGLQTINLGTGGTGAKTINIGTGAAVANQINLGGTGANAIHIGDTQTAGSISLGDAMTTGTINIGGTGLQTGDMDIAVGSGAQDINIGNNALGVKTIEIGNDVAGSTVVLHGGAGIGSAIIIDDGSFVINTGTGALQLSNDGAATAVDIATGAGVKTTTLGSTNTTSTTTINSGTGGIQLVAPLVRLNALVNIYVGAGAPGAPLALEAGDMYIRTNPTGPTERLYIATGVGTWTNVTCAA